MNTAMPEWEAGEDEKPELQGQEESSVETGPPNRSVKLPWVAPLAGNWRMKTYLTVLFGVFPINLYCSPLAQPNWKPEDNECSPGTRAEWTSEG